MSLNCSGRKVLSSRISTVSKLANSRAASQLRALSTNVEQSSLQQHSAWTSSASSTVESTSFGSKDLNIDPFFSNVLMSTPLAPKQSTLPISELTTLEHALENNSSETWTKFMLCFENEPETLANLSRANWSKLFVHVSKQGKDDVNWEHLQIVFTTMVKFGHQLTPTELSIFMNKASLAGFHNVVQEVWSHINQSNIPKSILLWNTYMALTCNANPERWHRKFNARSRLEKEPPITKDPVDIISEMIADGLSPNNKTYEQAIMSLGQSGDLDYASGIISSVWKIKFDNSPLENDEDSPGRVLVGSPFYPKVSTLAAVINAYGVQDQLVEGLKVMQNIKTTYDINISKENSLELWEAILKWALLTKEPTGSTPAVAFDAVWQSITTGYKLKPTTRMYKYKQRFELSKHNFKGILDLVPVFLKRNNAKAAGSALFDATTSMARHGQAENAISLIQSYVDRYPQLESRAYQAFKYINKSPQVKKFTEQRARLATPAPAKTSKSKALRWSAIKEKSESSSGLFDPVTV